MDVNLLPVKKRADEGDIKALIQMGEACAFGDGVPFSNLEAAKYGVRCHELGYKKFEKEARFFFEHLLCWIAKCYRIENEHKLAIEWYHRATDFIFNTYFPDYAELVMEEHRIRYYIEKIATYPEPGIWLHGVQVLSFD